LLIATIAGLANAARFERLTGLDESNDSLIRYALMSYESGFQVHPSVSR
jgi:hypothetical protein